MATLRSSDIIIVDARKKGSGTIINISDDDAITASVEPGTTIELSHGGYPYINLPVTVDEDNSTITDSGTYKIAESFTGTVAIDNTTSVTIEGSTNDNKIYNYGGSDVSIDSGAGDDSIYNSGSNVTINGGAGDDTIVGRFWDSSVDGGAGSDIISMSGDVDRATISGGTGDDTVYFDNYDGLNLYKYASGDGNDIIYNFNTRDTLQIDGGTGAYSTQVSGSDIIVTVGEGMITLSGAATLSSITINETRIYPPQPVLLTPYADNYSNTVNGATIQALGGDDTIYNSGSEVLFKYYTGDGNDSIIGFNDTSTLEIGDGTGIYSTVQSGDDIIVSVDSNKITLKGAATLQTLNIIGEEKEEVPTVIFNNRTKSPVTVGSAYQNADATARTTAIKITGNAQDNSIVGGTANDTIDGGKGDDIIYGGTGNDSLVGNAGSDELYGEAGNDTLRGNNGNDTLTGGEGSDMFLCGAGRAGDKLCRCCLRRR